MALGLDDDRARAAGSRAHQDFVSGQLLQSEWWNPGDMNLLRVVPGATGRLTNSKVPQRRARGKLDSFELSDSTNHLVVYHASALDTIRSLSEKWCIEPEHLHRANANNSSYQTLMTEDDTNDQSRYDIPLSSSARNVNVIYCWTRPADKFVSFDNIPIGFKVLKEFEGLGFFEGEVVRKLADQSIKIRYEDSDQEDLEVEEVLRFHMLWDQRGNVYTC